MADWSRRWTVTDYKRAAPAVREDAHKFERALEAVRRTHRRRPVDEVRQALAIAVEQQGLKSPSDVLTEAARLISTEIHS